MRILGIDPGIGDLGWGLIELHEGRPEVLDYGVVKTSPEHGDDWYRAKIIARRVGFLAVQRRVSFVAAEGWNYYSKHKTTAAFPIGLVIGGIQAAVSCPFFNAGIAAEWHKSLGLSPHATKPDVQDWLFKNFRVRPTPQHASDAVAVAIAAIPKVGVPEVPFPESTGVRSTMRRARTKTSKP